MQAGTHPLLRGLLSENLQAMETKRSYYRISGTILFDVKMLVLRLSPLTS